MTATAGHPVSVTRWARAAASTTPIGTPAPARNTPPDAQEGSARAVGDGGQSARKHGQQHQGERRGGEQAVTGDDRYREGPFGGEIELGRPARPGFGGHVGGAGIHRVNMVWPSVAMPPKIPTAAQPAASEPDSRWITQNTSPVKASRTCPR